MADERVYVCFNRANPYNPQNPPDLKICYVASSPLGQFEEITHSYEQHSSIRIAASESKFSSNLTLTPMGLIFQSTVKAKKRLLRVIHL